MQTHIVKRSRVQAGKSDDFFAEIEKNPIILRRFLSGLEYKHIIGFLKDTEKKNPESAKKIVESAWAREKAWLKNKTVDPDVVPQGARALAYWFVDFTHSLDLSNVRLRTLIPKAIKKFKALPKEETDLDPLGDRGTTGFKHFVSTHPSLNWMENPVTFATAIEDFKKLASGERQIRFLVVKKQNTLPALSGCPDPIKAESDKLVSLMQGTDQKEPAPEDLRIKMAFTRVTIGTAQFRRELFNALLGEVVTGKYADTSIHLAFSKAREVAKSHPNFTLTKECVDKIVPKLLSVARGQTTLFDMQMFNFLVEVSNRQSELAREIGAALDKFIK